MKNIIWKYVKPLVDGASIEEYETRTGASLPDDIKETVRLHNGGRPSLKYFDLPNEADKEFKSLLSFNRSDVENVFAFYPIDSSDKDIVPFAIDPAGNLFVIKGGNIHLWLHETDKTVFLANSFSAFLETLHE